MRLNKTIPINQSPFHKESHFDHYKRGSKKMKVDFKISPSAYNDLLTYFNGRNIDKSDGFREIIFDKLETINTWKNNCFNNIEILMLIPIWKIKEKQHLSKHSDIIGVINTECDFIDSYNHVQGFQKTPLNIRYEMKQIHEYNFPFDILQSTKEPCLFHFESEDLKDFDSFYNRLDELTEFHLDEYAFTRFPLNNYLDINRQGEFQHPKYMGKHQGIYIFDNIGYRRLFWIIDWEYSGDGFITFSNSRFIDMVDFMKIVKNADYKPLRDYYKSVWEEDQRRESIERDLKEAIELKEYAESRIKFYENIKY